MRSYNAFSNLQLQSGKAGELQDHYRFPACSCANAFCHARLQTRIARAPRQIDQRKCSVNSADSTTQIRCCSLPCMQVFFYAYFFLNSRSRYSLVHILPTSSSQSALRLSVFDVLKCKPSSRYSPAPFVRCFPRSTCRHADLRKQTPYFGDPRSHMTSKTTGFRTRMSSPVYSHASELLLLLPHANCFCCLCCGHADKTAPGHSSLIRKFWN